MIEEIIPIALISFGLLYGAIKRNENFLYLAIFAGIYGLL